MEYVALISIISNGYAIRHRSSRQAEYITSTFDIHYSIFDIRFSRVSLSIKLAAFQAGDGAHRQQP